MKELKMFIDGRFIEHESGKWIKVLNLLLKKLYH